MSDDKYALSEAWTRGKEHKQPFDYTIKASGQTVLLKRLDMGDLLKLGIAEQMDFMSKSLVAEDKPAGDEAKSAQDAVASAILEAGNYSQMELMINTVCTAGIIKPSLQMPPEHEAARQKGMLYIDSIPFADRMELFSVIYDAEGLVTFREEQANGVGDVADVPSVQLPADRPVDVRPDDTEGLLLQPSGVPVREAGGIGDEQSGIDEPGESESGTGNGRIGKHSTVGSVE